MRGGGSILRQLSGSKGSGKFSEKDWEKASSNSRKRVIVAVNGSKEAKHALLWALSHVVNSFDTVTLLNVIDDQNNPNFMCIDGFSDVIDPSQTKRLVNAKERELVTSLKGLCKAHRPEVNVEVLVTQGERATTIVRLVKKLEASLLVLGQTRPSLLERIFGRKKGGLVQYCIDNADCLTLAVRKQSKRIGGYERLKPNTWSGAYHCWGKENREAPIRTACPPGISSEVVSNFEMKAFDGCANPYLGLAAIIAAGIDGLRKHLVLPEPVDSNPYDLKEGAVHRLPTSLAESVTELRKNEVLKSLIGDKLMNAIIAVREAEVRYYSVNKHAMEQLIHRY